jgi:undecaprenyl-phosphate 4-deoxy-4-formamido-L-arabinose transferase
VKISIVIPCYRSEKTIEKVVSDITGEFEKRLDHSYEIVLVNDQSPDQVFSVIRDLAKSNRDIIGISLAKNFGQHAAIMAGFHHVTGDIVVVMDDDGQTPPKEMFKLIEGIEQGSDIVFAKYEHKKHQTIRNLGSRLNDKMATTLLGKPKNLAIMSYFACRKYVVDEVAKYSNPYPYIWGLLLQVTSNIQNVNILHKERSDGSSGYTFSKLVGLWINGFTAFSVKPLRIASLLGALFSVGGFLFTIFIIIKKLLTMDMPVGYSSTIAAILIIGGFILLTLGLIGEYIGRIYISLNNAPQFVVREIIEHGQDISLADS